MTEQQIRLIEESFEQITPHADRVTRLFYERVFELDPTILPMFTLDIKAQGRKLMLMLNAFVRCLRDPFPVLEELCVLGQRHAEYGVQPHHYETIGTALFWTFEQVLGIFFQTAVHDAWQLAYRILTSVMLIGHIPHSIQKQSLTPK